MKTNDTSAPPHLVSLDIASVRLNVLQLRWRYPGVVLGQVVDEQEPWDAPERAQTPKHIEDRGPSIQEGGVAEPAPKGHGYHCAYLNACTEPDIRVAGSEEQPARKYQCHMRQ